MAMVRGGRQIGKAGLAPHAVRRTPGVTLIELVVVIAIIGILSALLLSAVQYARESARRVECRNHLRQQALAIHTHHDVHRQFPTNGWGHRWTGQDDGGFGPKQPGGWIFNLLPFLEQEPLRNLGQGQGTPERASNTRRMLQTAIPIFQCPTRRAAGPHPYHGSFPLINAPTPQEAAKSDYAINGGDTKINGGPGPASTDPRVVAAYQWPDAKSFNGIAFVRSKVRMADVQDGTSSTYLAGEKYVSFEHRAISRGDDQAMFIGDDADLRRWTVEPPWPDSKRIDNQNIFGSAHSAGCHFAMCDGSVQLVSYSIDAHVHRLLGNRKDGQPLPDNPW